LSRLSERGIEEGASPLTNGSSLLKRRVEQLMMSRHFWLVAALLVTGLVLQYSAQERPLFPSIFPSSPVRLGRHALERILFILPITYAAFMFGLVGGLVTLLVSLLIMLPRVFFASPQPVDALFETISVALVGGLICWLIAIQDREKKLHQDTMGRLTAVGAVSDVLIQSLNLDQILDGALEKMVEILGVERQGGIFLVDQEEGELVLAAHQGLPPEFAQAEARIKIGECLCGRAAQTGEVLVSEECPSSPRHANLGLGQQHWHVIMPLRAQDRVVGVLFLYATRPFEYSPSDVGVLTTIGNQVGVAVENALLHQDVARQLDRERRLNEVAQKITSELELSKVLPTVVRIAEELVDADAGVIALLDEEGDVITYPYLHNIPAELTEVTVPRGEGLAGQVMISGHPMVVEDYSTYPEAVEPFVRAGVASVVAVPIVSGDRVFGTLAVFSLRERKVFSERDMVLIAGVGRQAGIAIENAHLYENLRFYVRQRTRAQEDERRRIARELHDDTAQALALLSRRIDALASFQGGLPEPAMQQLETLRELTSSTLQGVRRFSQDLRPPALDDLGLLPALEGLTTDPLKLDGMEAKLEVLGDQRRLPPEAELVLFRITQEALRNVEKHSQASMVVVTVEFSETKVRIAVSDNGRGFQLPEMMGNLAQIGKLGLIGMQERAQLLGGTLTVRSALGQGTTMVVEVPV
jgi:two-component system sensor histidine kinase DegS